MEVQAINKFVDISPRKARLVLDEVRGRQAEEAIAVLSYMPQHAARVVSKTIQSALANAVENFGYDAKDMVCDANLRGRWPVPPVAALWRARPVQAVAPSDLPHHGGLGGAGSGSGACRGQRKVR